ncbi:MAG: TolC family protein [Leptospirales bacterium]
MYYISKSILKFSRSFAAVLIFVLTASVSYSQSAKQNKVNSNANKKHLTLNDYIESALYSNPTIIGASESRNRYKNLYEKEKALPDNPVFSASYQNVPLNTFPALDQSQMSSVTLSLSQKIPTMGEAKYRNQMAYWSYIGEFYQYWEIRNRIVLKVKLLYHDLHFLYQKKNILRQSETALLNIVSVARAMVSVNKMNSSHLLKLEADLSVLKNKLLELEAQIVSAGAKLEELTGLKRPVYKHRTNQTSVWMRSADLVELPKGFNYRNHPLYLGMEAALLREDAVTGHAKSKALPGVTVTASYSVRSEIQGVSPGDDFISFKVSTPIPLYYAAKEKKDVKASQNQREVIRNKKNEIELALINGWKGESEKAKHLLAAYKGYQQDVIPRYFASYNALLGSLSAGTVTLLDVLDSYRLYLASVISQAELFRNLRYSTSIMEYYLAVAPQRDTKHDPKNKTDVEPKNENENNKGNSK